MSAAEALALAESAGVLVRLEGDTLRLVARVEPPPDVLAALKAAKLEIVALLSGGQDGPAEANGVEDHVARILTDHSGDGCRAVAYPGARQIARGLGGDLPQSIATRGSAYPLKLARYLLNGRKRSLATATSCRKREAIREIGREAG